MAFSYSVRGHYNNRDFSGKKYVDEFWFNGPDEFKQSFINQLLRDGWIFRDLAKKPNTLSFK